MAEQAEHGKYIHHNDTVVDGKVVPKSPTEISDRVYRLMVDSGMGEPSQSKTTGYRTWSGFSAPKKAEEGGEVAATPEGGQSVSQDNPTTRLDEAQLNASAEG